MAHPEEYPINFLRNVALQHLQSPIAFVADARTYFPDNLPRLIKDAVQKVPNWPDRTALVLPTVQLSSNLVGQHVENKERLIELLESNDAGRVLFFKKKITKKLTLKLNNNKKLFRSSSSMVSRITSRY